MDSFQLGSYFQGTEHLRVLRIELQHPESRRKYVLQLLHRPDGRDSVSHSYNVPHLPVGGDGRDSVSHSYN